MSKPIVQPLTLAELQARYPSLCACAWQGCPLWHPHRQQR
jgi:hypothetical protein